MKKIIYLDNAATTAINPEVVKIMTDALTENYYNPSALYAQSIEISDNIKRARETIKTALHAPEGELYFTSGGTESNNTALFRARKQKNGKIIVGMGEHDSVFAPANELKAQGYDVQFAPINADGTVNVEQFKTLLDESVSLVSIMHASNETGGVNDITLLSKLTKKVAPKAIFHSDGVQAFGKIPVNLRNTEVDLYSISAHKINGPKGIGALFVRKGTSVKPLLYGGGQEKGMRSGTENYPSILGFEYAVKNAILNDFDKKYSQMFKYREYLYTSLLSNIENCKIITDISNSVPNILTVAFDKVRGEVLLHSLERYGILVGTGSACSSHHESRFKALLELDENHRDGVIRFSIGEQNEMDEIDEVVGAIKTELFTLTKFRRI